MKNPRQRVSWVLAPFPSPKSRPAPHRFYPCFHGTSNRLLDGLISPQFARVICIAGPRGKRTRPECSQAKRTMRLDVLRAAKHGHQSARLMCPTGWVGGMIAGQGDGDRNPAISAAICADRELHVRCTCNNVPRPSQEAPARKSRRRRSAQGSELVCQRLEPRMPVNGTPVSGSLACTELSHTWDCAVLFSACVGQP